LLQLRSPIADRRSAIADRLMKQLALLASLVLAVCPRASAQPPSPRIGLFVVDVRGTFPNFPASTQLAESRGVATTDLPGLGIGVQVGAHIYFFRWKAITFGVGGELMTGRSHSNAQAAGLPSVTERFTSAAPQLSFNFGSSKGWSYLSGGIGPSTWSVVPDGSPSLPVDEERLKTINYGGGARWFAKTHLAFTFDVRFYAINPSTAPSPFPPSPRTTLLVIGAGVSVR
jgi:hypothetical protein